MDDVVVTLTNRSVLVDAWQIRAEVATSTGGSKNPGHTRPVPHEVPMHYGLVVPGVVAHSVAEVVVL